MDSIARHLFLSALYFALIGLPSASFAAENICYQQGLEIRQAEIRATPPNAPVTGGYLHIHNNGTAMQRLTAASADFSSHTEIHQMIVEAGVMKMSPLKDGIEMYKTPIGKKIAQKTPLITQETMNVSMQWGMESSSKIQELMQK